MFWIVDSILMKRRASTFSTGVRFLAGYDRLQSEEGDGSSESGLDGEKKFESFELQLMHRTSALEQSDSDK